ncbi:MAG: O-antigen ligase family protein [Bacteroidales bacterium]
MSKKQKTIKGRSGTGYQAAFYLFFTGLIIVLPLVYAERILDPTLTPRLFGLSILLLIFLSLGFSKKIYRRLNTSVLRNPMFLMLLLYAVITALSMLFSINYKEGFYDSGKSFAMLILAGIAAIMYSFTPGWHEKIPKLVLISAIISLIIGIHQYLNEVLLSSETLLSDGRPLIYLVDGLMAHKNQYAISLLLMLPFVGFGIFQARGILRALFIIITSLLMIFLVILETRSTWVGVLVGSAAMVLVLMAFGRHFGISRQLRIIILAGAVTASLGLLVSVAFLGRDNPESVFSRLRSILNPEYGNNVYRLKIWNITGQMIKDQPLQGVGAGNWKINSAYYYKGQKFQKDQLNWIRPHNDFLWVFSEKGILGFLIFTAIFVYALFMMIKIFKSAAVSLSPKVFILFMFGGLISYLSVSLFTFPLERINHQVYLMLILSAAVGIYHREMVPARPLRVSRFAIVIPAVLCLAFSVAYSTSVIKLETIVKQARAAQFQNNWKRMLQLANEIPTTFRNIDAEAVPVAWYGGLAHANLNQPEKALLFYLKAVKNHPTRVMVLNNLGKTYINLGEYQKGQQVLLSALDILPDYPEALTNLSASYYEQKNYQQALKYLREIPPHQRTEIVNRNIKALQKMIKEPASEK